MTTAAIQPLTEVLLLSLWTWRPQQGVYSAATPCLQHRLPLSAHCWVNSGAINPVENHVYCLEDRLLHSAVPSFQCPHDEIEKRFLLLPQSFLVYGFFFPMCCEIYLLSSYHATVNSGTEATAESAVIWQLFLSQRLRFQNGLPMFSLTSFIEYRG